MPEISESQLKDAVAALHSRREPARNTDGLKRMADRRAAAETLERAFDKIGLDLGELDRLIRENRAVSRHDDGDAKPNANIQKSADDLSLRHGLEGRQRALDQLATSPAGPTGSSFISLDKPFLILQLPHSSLDQLVDSHIEPLNSWARIRIATGAALSTAVHFFFMWHNDDDYYAVVNVIAPIVLRGTCDAYADTGIVSGDQTGVYNVAELDLIEWWNQPATSPLRQESQTKIVTSISASGGGLFSLPDHQGVVYTSVPFDLKYDLFAVPPHSAAVFDVSLHITAGFGPDNQANNPQDEVVVDFSNVDYGHRVLAPFVQLELLTKPSSTA